MDCNEDVPAYPSTQDRQTGADRPQLPLAQLCEQCDRLFRLGPYHAAPSVDGPQVREWSEVLLHQNAYDLEKSAAICVFCAWIWTRIPPETRNRLRVAEGEEILPIWVSFKFQKHKPKFLWLLLDISRDVWDMSSQIWYDEYSLVSVDALDPFVNHNKIMPSTSSSTTRKRVGGWLEACERHSCGHSRKAPKWHPTRLLDIGTSSSSAIKLCEAEEIELMADYATLSHRWASQEIPKLTSEGRASMKRGVLPRPLTRTMLDAVQVAREWLNVRYLWIDSLCIIQDSQEDWVTESAMMAEVYRNSYCNIAGAAASTDGLFVDRDVSMVQPYVIDVKWGTEFRAPGQYVFYHDTRWQHSIRYSPLMKRAWCIQEIFLAPRTLHFGSLQVGWECNEAQACETVPLGLDHKPLWIEEFPSAWKDICRIRDQQVSVAPDTHIKLDRPKLYKLWDAVVTRYSLAHLSFVKDKLAALAGIASFVEDLLEDEYLVGMWRSDLARQLCWFGMNPDRCTRPSEYIAPTWSWLSLNNSHISKPDYREYAVFVDIQDAQVLCEPNDRETSKKVRITGGFLDVACFLVPGVLTVKDVAGGRAYKVSGKGSSFPLKFRMDIDIHLHETRDVWLMPVLGGRTLTGLILERRNNDKGAFRRLGMFDKFYWGTHFWELAFESIPGATGTIATESQRLWRPQEPWEDEEPFHKTEAPLRKSRSAFEDWDDVTKPSDGVWFLDISRVVHGNERGLPPPYKKYDGVSRLKIRII